MRKLTTSEFINRAQLIHNNKYQYKNTKYTNAKTKVFITCPIHGDFLQSPDSHLRGKGCPECKKEKLSKDRADTKEQFIDKANKIHYNFYLYDKCIYKNSSTPVIITCPIHGDFEQYPSNHLSGKGCLKCGRERTAQAHTISEQVFIERVKNTHPEYDYSNTHYTKMENPITYICPIHGEVTQIAADHYHSKAGCPKCNKSKGELLISRYLNLYKIQYIQQYTIPINKNIRISGKAYIDFYLPDYNTFVEYNGIQHYLPVKHFGGEIKLQDQQNRDQAVRDYCKEHSINLIEIPYNDSNIAKYLQGIIPYIDNLYVNYFGDTPPDYFDIKNETSTEYLKWKFTNGEETVMVPVDFFYTLLECYSKQNNLI